MQGKDNFYLERYARKR